MGNNIFLKCLFFQITVRPKSGSFLITLHLFPLEINRLQLSYSLLVKITEQIPEYGSTESLQKSFSESNLPNNTVNGPTGKA